MSITVKKLDSDSDIAKCLEIYNSYIVESTATFEEQPLLFDQFKSRVERIMQKYPFYVATMNGNVVGFAYLDMFGERSAYRYTADLSVYVDDRHIGCGVGTKLLEAVEKAAISCGLKQIVSLVTTENTGSMRFHENNGFVFSGELADVGYKFGRWLGIRFYRKAL